MARLVVNSERPILLSRGTSAGVALTASRSLFRRSSSYGLTSRVLKPISNQCDLLRTATRLKTPSAIRGLYTAQSLTAPSRHPHVRLPRYALPSPVPRPGCSRSTRISRSFRAKASTSCPSCRSRAGERTDKAHSARRAGVNNLQYSVHGNAGAGFPRLIRPTSRCSPLVRWRKVRQLTRPSEACTPCLGEVRYRNATSA
jgi:hypothetical protein